MRHFDRQISMSVLIALMTLAPSAAGCVSPDFGDADAPAAADAVPPRGPSSNAPSPLPAPGSSPSSSLPPASPGPQTTDLYHSAKGDPKNQAVIFIHGGPGANSKMFELTVQESIAKLGYYVVAYDQRGSSRSPQGTTKDYSFAKATQDLDDLVGALGLTKPILLGHSFGGSIALHYLERFKGKAKRAIFVASPMSFPVTYDTTLAQCAARYTSWGRASDARKVEALRATMFPNGVKPPYAFTNANIDAVIACQVDAKLYFPPLPTQGQLAFALGGGLDAEVTAVNAAVGPGFQANDQVGYADFTTLLQAHKSEVHGIYAPSWDVMFSSQQLATIQANTTSFATVSNAGHFIYVDQPKAFVTTLARALVE
jgi:proline iminopeptidase